MKRIPAALLLITFAACAQLTAERGNTPDPVVLWDRAHNALAAEQFQEARVAFQRLVSEYPDQTEGREALFYLGSLFLDPRNPRWDPRAATDALQRYLMLDDDDERIYRRPEAVIFFQLATELNRPPDERRAGLQPETRIVRIPQPDPAAPDSQSLALEVERLQQLLAERDSVIRSQREELERIRRTLTPRTP